MSTPFKFKDSAGNTVDFEDYYVRSDYFRSGNLWVWGRNAYGQLGDNTIIDRSSPVQTIAWGSNWKEVSVGSNHTTCIKTDGTLWCWGQGTLGRLGDNTVTKRSSPVQTIAYGTNWKQVSAGYTHTAAIKTDGTLWCWGENYQGKLGDNTIASKSSPVQTVTFGNNWKQTSAGRNHTAAIKTDGTLWTWGSNSYGQLGDNTISSKSSPIQTIAGGTNWLQVSCSDRISSAIKTDGTLWVWGTNSFGSIGDNTAANKSSPVQTVAGGTNWKQVSCGSFCIVAVKKDGTLWSWGWNGSGKLGDNTILDKSSPVQTVAFGTNWKQVAFGDNITAAVKTDGTLWTWGQNNNLGQLGDNTRIDRSSPVQTIMYGTNWKSVACGRDDTAAIQYQDDYQ